MTEPLAVGTGDRVTFPAVMGAGDLNLIGLVNGKQVAVPPFLVPAGDTVAWPRARRGKIVIPKSLAPSLGLA
jgi:hypothetical protein